jgi:hypothetical protein
MRARSKMKNTHFFKAVFNLLLVLIVNLGFATAFVILFGFDLASLPEHNFESFLISVPFISIAALIIADYLQMTRFYLKTMLDIVMMAFKFTFLEVLIASTS